MVAITVLMLAQDATVTKANQEPIPYVVGLHDTSGFSTGGLYCGARVVALDPKVRFLVAGPATDATAACAGFDPNVRYHHWEIVGNFIDSTYGNEAPQGPGSNWSPDDPLFPTQYGPQQVRAPGVWEHFRGNDDASVCVIDTGVNYLHEDLAPRYEAGIDLFWGDLDPFGDGPMDDGFHGTHVAGIAVGTIHNGKGMAGLANVRLFGVKVLGPAGDGSDWNLALGISWCADNGGPRTVISMSLGRSAMGEVVHDSVKYASSRGALLVAAAGNDAGGPILVPAAYPEVVAVTCTSLNSAHCPFSSQGTQAEISAPGNLVLSAAATGSTGYHVLSGTSMSTPHVSGAASLLWSANPWMSAQDVRSRLQDTSSDLGAPSRDPVFGFGELDVTCLYHDIVPCPPHAPSPP